MKLTRRGKVVTTVFAVVLLWAVWQVATNLWWIDCDLRPQAVTGCTIYWGNM